jgi:hypothetical protein
MEPLLLHPSASLPDLTLFNQTGTPGPSAGTPGPSAKAGTPGPSAAPDLNVRLASIITTFLAQRLT